MLDDDNVNQLVEFDVMSVSIRFSKDNYDTINPSIYVKKLGDAVDCVIWWWHVVMDDLDHSWHNVAISIIYRVQ